MRCLQDRAFLWGGCGRPAPRLLCRKRRSLCSSPELRTGPGFPHLERGGERLHAAHQPDRGGAAPRSCCSPETPQHPPRSPRTWCWSPEPSCSPRGPRALGSYSPRLPGGCWASQLVPVTTAARGGAAGGEVEVSPSPSGPVPIQLPVLGYK